MRKLTLVVSLLLAVSSFAEVWNESDPQLKRAFERAPHMILHPSRPLTDADRVELRANGVDVQRPLTGGRYIARVVSTARAAADARVESVEPMTAEHKILRSAMRFAANGRTWADVTIVFHDDVSIDNARTAILGAGGALADAFTTEFGAARRIDARIAPTSLTALAADDRVLAIGAQLREKAIEHNAVAAAVSHVTELYSAPYNLSGAGQLVMVSELSDAQFSHPEFGGRMLTGGTGQNGEHSTHVSGTIGASGVNPAAKGMAPAVQIREYNVGGTVSSHVKALNTHIPEDHPIANNTSLGFPLGWCDQCDTDKPIWLDDEELFGAYDGIATAIYDDLTAKYDTLLVFSAGNDGTPPVFQTQYSDHFHANDEGDPDGKTYCVSVNRTGNDCPAGLCSGGCEVTFHHSQNPFDTMTVTGAAKNVLAVGAIDSDGTSAPTITSFSSRGPAKDGRVKPDLVARGRRVFSTLPNNNYGRSDGTSMAAPVVTGIAALMGEQWQKTFGARPSAIELRAVLLAGTRDLGNPGPDYTYGFGLVDAKNSADLIIGDGGTRSQIASVTVAQSQVVERTLTVTSAQNLRVLVTWADPSVVLLGNDAFNAKALVNDLDIQVIGPDGTTVLPYVLDKVHYEDPATHGVNTTDNTELIDIANAAPGTYRLRIIGRNLSKGPQNAIVVSNVKGAVFIPCSDIQEPNNSAESAWGNVPPGATVSGAICSASDTDFIKFEVTRFGPIAATITTGDSALRATLAASNGQSATIDIPANTTQTVSLQYGSGTAGAPPLNVTLKIEAAGNLGIDPRYTVALSFGQTTGPRRRSSRH
ncbi:MAG TPA: S8 family serine peptidase [Thermoanaerobaculia bacterium]|nr:S8 family serine peptidase [Thermoanaerobaculia bacterium]